MALTALACAAALFLLLIIIRRLSRRLFSGLAAAGVGVLAAAYVQMLFFNGRMIALSDDKAAAEVPAATLVLDLAVFAVIALAPLVLLIIFSVRHSPKAAALLRAGVFICAAVTAMQTVGLVSSAAGSEEGAPKLGRGMFMYKPLAQLSEQQNVIVFLVDRLDSSWMDELISIYPELTAELDGFTFYQNNMSHYTNTFPSVAAMLSSTPYDDTSWHEFLDTAWQGSVPLDTLRENGYRVNLLLDSLTSYNDISQLTPHCDNADPSPEVEITVDNAKVIDVMSRLAASRLLPYAFKNIPVKGFRSSVTNDFFKWRYTGEQEYAPPAVGPESDLKFNKYITANGLSLLPDGKVFSFIHLNGAHDPDKALIALHGSARETEDRHTNVLRTARGDFETILFYIREAKRLGVYDNTAFIILADHGAKPYELDEQDELMHANASTLLVKPPHAPSGSLKLNSTAELSNDMFSASVLEYAGLDHSALGDSYSDIVSSGRHVDRYFETFRFMSYGHEVKLHTYRVRGNARDFSDWEKID